MLPSVGSNVQDRKANSFGVECFSMLVVLILLVKFIALLKVIPETMLLLICHSLISKLVPSGIMATLKVSSK